MRYTVLPLNCVPLPVVSFMFSTTRPPRLMPVLVIPLVTSIIAGLLMILVGFSGGWEMGLYCIFVYVLVQTVDGNIIVPMIAKKTADLAPALVLGAQLIMGALFGLLGLILLVLPLAPIIGTTVNGATLWIRIGGLSFQPAELAKILLTIFFAGYLVVKRDSLALVRTKFLGLGFPRPKDLGPLLIAWLISLAVLVFENDLGTSMLFFGLFVGMLYIGWEVAGSPPPSTRMTSCWLVRPGRRHD